MTFGFVQGIILMQHVCVAGIHMVPDDVYGDVCVIDVSALHVGGLKIPL